jgi:hypothetical protein
MSDVILIDKLLLDAIALIRNEEWGQGHDTCRQGVYCLITAIYEVADNYPLGTALAATQHLGIGCLHEAYSWNDAPGRTVDEVIARLQSGVRADITEA